jgi:hypothetical protein
VLSPFGIVISTSCVAIYCILSRSCTTHLHSQHPVPAPTENFWIQLFGQRRRQRSGMGSACRSRDVRCLLDMRHVILQLEHEESRQSRGALDQQPAPCKSFTIL